MIGKRVGFTNGSKNARIDITVCLSLLEENSLSNGVSILDMHILMGSVEKASMKEPVKGFEPPAGGLQNRCSTPELHRLANKTHKKNICNAHSVPQPVKRPYYRSRGNEKC